MTRRSYYTTPGLVLTALISLGIFVYAHNTGQYEQELQSKIFQTSLQQYADHVPVLHALKNKPTADHIPTPESVRAIYISSWVAGTPSLRNRLIDFVFQSEINSVVIDIKDSTGVISFDIEHPLIDSLETDSTRIANIEELIEELHAKNIYVIGRLTAFQDPLLSKKKPEWSFKRIDNQEVWKDRKGLSFINPRFEGPWSYLATIAELSYDKGFDEINIDYIRFPSDGDISNINYLLAEGEDRRMVMKSFYEYMDTRLRGKDIPLSADIFGLVTTAQDDIGIGQYFEDIYPHFDAIAPMVYPSHYSSGFFGYQNPNSDPYEVVKAAMNSAKKRAEAIGEDPDKLRTWIQDFNISEPNYGVAEIKEQIQATYDIGLDSYMSWDPKNRYTQEAYK